MLPLLFIGGAITGAAGLLTAALYDKKKTEAAYSPDLKNPEKLDENAAARQLNAYFFKAQAIYSKVNETIMESAELISTPIELPDDDFLQKVANKLGSGANRLCRSFRSKQMADLKNDAEKLYGRYRGVFLRANAILRERGENPVTLKPVAMNGASVKINNSLENDDWNFDLDSVADQIREYIERSCSIAEELIDRLEGRAPLAIEEAAGQDE